MIDINKPYTTRDGRPVPEWATHFAGGKNEICKIAMKSKKRRFS